MSMEFVAYVGIIVSVLVLASYAAIASGREISDYNEVTDARRIASKVAQEINIAVEVGPGYSHIFSLPEFFSGGSNYTVVSESRFVYVIWGNKSYSLPVLAYNITGIVKKSVSTVRNENGVISFE